MQSLSFNPLIATFQLSSAASLNLGRSQNCVLGNGFNKKKCGKTMGKGENADNQYVLLFPRCFQPFLKKQLCIGEQFIHYLQTFVTFVYLVWRKNLMKFLANFSVCGNISRSSISSK